MATCLLLPRLFLGDGRRLAAVSSDSRSSEDPSQPPTANQRSPAGCGQYPPLPLGLYSSSSRTSDVNDEAGYRLAAGASWLDTFYSVLFALFWDVILGQL